MRRLVTALLAVILIGALAPLAASAQDIRVGPGMRPDGPAPAVPRRTGRAHRSGTGPASRAAWDGRTCPRSHPRP